MISPATLADWLQALFLGVLLGTLALTMGGILRAEAEPLDDNADMKRDDSRNAA